jgi:hypothetical protein
VWKRIWKVRTPRPVKIFFFYSKKKG